MTPKRIRYKIFVDGAKQAQAKFVSLGKSIQGTAIAVGAGLVAFTALKRMITSSVKAYTVQEDAEKSLERALGGVNQKLLDQASALQRVTRYGDEAIIGAQAMIASFVQDEDQIKKATIATLDLASAKKMDLRAAADLVSKTLGSSTNAMSRYGIQVEGAVGSTERLESLTKSVARVFGGDAQSQAETFGGQLEQVSNAAGDTAEQLGRIIVLVTSESGALSIFRNTLEDITSSLERINKVSDIWVALLAMMTTDYADFEQIWDSLGSKVEEKTKDQDDAADDLNTTIEKLLPTYEEWLNKRRESAELAELEEGFLNRYSATFEGINELLPIAVTNADRMTANIEQTADALEEVKTEADETAKVFSDDWLTAASMLSGAFDFAFKETLVRGENLFTSLYAAFTQMLASMMAELAGKAALFGFLNLISGGGFSGLTSFTNFLGFGQHGMNAEIPKMQSGGSLRVGGSGGVDSQLVALNASPGETVNVTPEGASPGGGYTIIIQGDVYDGDRLGQKITNTLDRYMGRNR